MKKDILILKEEKKKFLKKREKPETAETEDFRFIIQKSDNIAQDIKKYQKKYKTNNYFYKQKHIYCARYFDWKERVIRYVKMQHIALFDADFFLICDDPKQIEDFLFCFCKKLHSVSIITKEKQRFSVLIHYFFENYGILFSVGDTIDKNFSDHAVFILFSTQKEWLSSVLFRPILNLSGEKSGEIGVFETVEYTARSDLFKIAAEAGGFTDSFLNYLFSVYDPNFSEKKYQEFVSKYQIKMLKIVKNS